MNAIVERLSSVDDDARAVLRAAGLKVDWDSPERQKTVGASLLMPWLAAAHDAQIWTVSVLPGISAHSGYARGYHELSFRWPLGRSRYGSAGRSARPYFMYLRSCRVTYSFANERTLSVRTCASIDIIVVFSQRGRVSAARSSISLRKMVV